MWYSIVVGCLAHSNQKTKANPRGVQSESELRLLIDLRNL